MIFFPTTDEDFQYFRSQGYAGSINDMHYKALGDLNHTGALSDRTRSFLVSEYGSFHETMRDLRNTTASFVALRYGVGAIQPEFVLDFGEEYYRVDGLKTALSDTVTHSRASNATMVNSSGTLVTVGNNVPRTGHHIYDGYEWVNEGILHESAAATNLLLNSGTLSTQNATVAAAPNTLSFTGTGTVTLTGVSTAGPLVGTGTGENNRVNLTFTPTAGTLTLTVTGTVTNAQLELGSTPSSYIPTTGATATRAAETLVVAAANMPAYTDALSIQMQGKMTYADKGITPNVEFVSWLADTDNKIQLRVDTDAALTGRPGVIVREAGVEDAVFGSHTHYSPGINVPFDIASRNGSTFVNGAVDGTALTANTAPTVIPDLSAADFDIAPTFNGTIKSLRVWDKDISDTGIATASAPTFTDEFAMTVTTTTANETFTIPCQNVGTFNAGIQWGDGSVSTVTAYNDAKLTHTFATAGDHLIRIRGSFPNIYFNNAGDKLKVKSVHNLGIVGWTRLNIAFQGCSNMTSFTAGTTDTSAVTNMSYMFRDCPSLTALDLSSFNTAAVTSMYAMFYGCSSLTALDLSNFNTTAVVYMSNMFRECSSLTALDLSNFNTTVVTNMSNMFYGCTGLTALDVSSFNTTAVVYMNSMFRDNSSLTSLDVSSFNTAAVTEMSYMFYNCSSLTALDVSSFNTTAVVNASYMFYGCSSLTALDVSNFNTTAVTNMSNMFRSCTSLTALDLSNFNTAAVTTMSNMFRLCTNLTALDVSNFNTAAVTNMSNMFQDNSSLTSLDVSSFNTAAVTDMASMFQNCTSTTDIIGVEDFNIEGLNSTGDLSNFMTNVTLPTARYDALLINWDAQEPFDAMTPNFGNSTYTGGGTAAAARANLISTDLWVITDGGIA